MTRNVQAADTEGPDDGALLSRVAKQDRKAFEMLYRRYYQRVFQFVLRMVRREDAAEEVVDDVMFAVWRNAAQFEGNSKVSTWMLGIAYRQALKSLERNRKHSVVDSDEEVLAATEDQDPAMNPEHVAITESAGALLQKALATLGEHHRSVVELTAMGHSYSEISQVVGCPENTVKTRMFHARQHLLRFFAESDRTRSGFSGTKRSWTQNIQAI